MKTVSLKLKNGIRINISGCSYAQAMRGYIRMMMFVKRAERTARLMTRVSQLSSQCIWDWELLNHGEGFLKYNSAETCQEQTVSSHGQEQGEVSGSTDK